MIFTYAAEYAVLSDRTDIDDTSISYVELDLKPVSFNQFLEKNDKVTKKSISEHEAGGTGGFSYDIKKGTSYFVINSMINYYRTQGSYSLDMWWNSRPDVNTPPLMGKEEIMDQYEIYLDTNGYELKDGVVVKKKTMLWDDAMAFLGSIGDAIGRFFDLLTFNIRDNYGVNIIPAPVMFVLNIFFIPFWIVIGIEILPIVVAIVHAIGALLDSVTPLT